MEDRKELGTLIVVVGKARNLVNKSRFGKQDPFCTVSFGEDKQKTKAIKRQHPEWDEELRFTVIEDLDDVLARSDSTSDALESSTSSVSSLSKESTGVTSAQALAAKSRKGPLGKKGGKSMRVACYADDSKEPELIGECVVPIDEVLKQGEVDEWYEFLFKEKYSGEVYLELTFYSNNAPPVKRNVPRPSVNQFGGYDGGLGSSASINRLSLSSSLSASGSASGASLYIPPYVKPPTTPGPSHSGSFANLGLPPDQLRAHTPVPPVQSGYPAGHPPTPQPYSNNLSIDSLTRPMSSMSIASSGSQQPHGHGYGNHRHSLGGRNEAPWGSLLPQSQPPPPPASHPRPMSSNDAVPWEQLHRMEEERRRGGATPVPRPISGQSRPHDVYRQPSPIPPSLVPAVPPISHHHANSFSGGTVPAHLLHPASPQPDPIQHPSSAPPAPPATYYNASPSYAGISQALQERPPSAAPTYPPQEQYPANGYHPTPPRQPEYPPQPAYGTPSRTDPYHRNSLPEPAAYQSPPPPTPPKNEYGSNSSYPSSSQAPWSPQPPQAPAQPGSGGYVPWYQQTQPEHNPYASPPPPVPDQRPAPNPPMPSRQSVGYYPSDELYAQQPHAPQPSHTWQPPAPAPPPPRSHSLDQQVYPGQSYPSQASSPYPHQPPHDPYAQQPNHRHSIGYQPSPQAYRSSSPVPPQAPSYGRAPSPAPPQAYGRSPSPIPGYGRAPSPAPPAQQYYTPPPNQFPPRSASPLPPLPGSAPQLAPPSGYNGYDHRSPSPTPAPSTARQDWKSYMQNLSVGQAQSQPSVPIRAPSPQPPPKEWYTPPPTLPSSIAPPDGWRSTLPQDQRNQQWR